MKKVNLLLFIFQLLAFNLMAQESELVRLYKEFPDSLLKLYYYHNDEVPVFSQDSRTHFLNKCYYDKNRDEYSANMFREIDGWYEGADSKPMPDTTAEDYNSYDYEDNYVLKIHEDVGRISYEYNYEGQCTKLDFILVRETDMYYIVLLEQYLPGMGVPNLQEFTAYKFDFDNNLISTIPIPLPIFGWEDFYPRRKAKKIRRDLIGDLRMPYKLSVSDNYREVFICISPDLDDLAWRIMQTLEFGEEIGIGEAYQETYSKLGFDGLPKAQTLCIRIRGFIVDGP
ncbi:MAG: hypothetical protein PHE56_08235 [Bacteroidales bacterium]|nr:hypothetical protein [Bacteroidales bacterium]